MRRFATKGMGFAIEGLAFAFFLKIRCPLVCLGFGVGNGHREFSTCTVCLARFGNLLWLRCSSYVDAGICLVLFSVFHDAKDFVEARLQELSC